MNSESISEIIDIGTILGYGGSGLGVLAEIFRIPY
jgi:hypothetical protein